MICEFSWPVTGACSVVTFAVFVVGIVSCLLCHSVSAEKTNTPGEYKVNCVALPKDELILKLDKDGKPVLICTIAGKKAKLVRIYVFAVDGWLKPTVKWVKWFGVDEETGDPVEEKKKP